MHSSRTCHGCTSISGCSVRRTPFTRKRKRNEEEDMKPVDFAASLLATTLLAGAAYAQVSNDVIKIGVMNDQSGLYADLAGPGSVTAARMAVEDAGGK